MYKMLRVRVREFTYKKFKMTCVENNISMTGQAEKLINDFVKGKEKIEIPYEIIDKKI